MTGTRPLTALALLAALAACSRPGDHAVGVILPLEGRLMQGGHELQSGIDLALAELPPEQRPQVLIVDNAGDAQRSTQLVDGLVARGASVILGPLTTDDATAVGLAARAAGVACVAPAAGGTELVAPDSGCLRLSYGDDEVGTALARYARDTLRLARVALVVDLQSESSLDLAKAFGREFQRRGGRVVGRTFFHGGEPDAGGALDAAMVLGGEGELAGDGILVAAHAPDVVRMVNGATDARLQEQILLGGNGWDGAGVREAVAGRVRGAYRTRHFDPEAADPLVHEFVAAYRAAHQVDPPDLAALGYDAARAVLSVFDPSLPGPLQAARLRELRGHPGVTGALTLDARGAAIGKPILLEQLHDPGRPALLGRIDG